MYAAKTLENFSGDNNDETAGINIVKNSLKAPARRVLDNAGIDSALILAKLQEKNETSIIYDALSHKEVDAFKDGILDPTKVVRSALQSSISVASLAITTEVTICDAAVKNNTAGGAPSGGMPGMGGMGGMPMGM
jgi:chaperonin GroEL